MIKAGYDFFCDWENFSLVSLDGFMAFSPLNIWKADIIFDRWTQEIFCKGFDINNFLMDSTLHFLWRYFQMEKGCFQWLKNINICVELVLRKFVLCWWIRRSGLLWVTCLTQILKGLTKKWRNRMWIIWYTPYLYLYCSTSFGHTFKAYVTNIVFNIE